MISKEKLINALNNCTFTEFSTLPESKYTQKTYTLINNNEQERETLLKQQKQLKDIINSGVEYNVIKPENIDNFNELLKSNEKQVFKKNDINYKALLDYKENSIIHISEDIRNLLISLDDNNITSLKLIGFYNPNSFIKSIILLNDPKYILLNKYEMLSHINTYRSNLCYYYKEHKTNYINFPKDDFKTLEDSIMTDNFHSFSLSQIAVDYLNINILILDNINKKYEYYLSSLNNKDTNINNITTYVLVKYKECYLPIVNNNGDKGYLFKLYELLTILSNYEHLNSDYTLLKYKNNITNQEYSLINDNTIDNTNHTNNTSEIEKVLLSSLINISKYKREQLQEIAVAYNIPIVKKSSKGNYINKTKSDLFDDFKKVYYDDTIIINNISLV